MPLSAKMTTVSISELEKPFKEPHYRYLIFVLQHSPAKEIKADNPKLYFIFPQQSFVEPKSGSMKKLTLAVSSSFFFVTIPFVLWPFRERR